MVKPLVAIVGRPNVGKSTFFNRITGKRISIVEDTPGVTRDRVYADTDWRGCNFTVVDTGGIEIHSEDEMWMHIKKQAEIAVDLADVIVFMADGRQGITNDDFDVANLLRKSNKPIVLAVNKLDNPKSLNHFDFYQLGLGDPVPISAEQGINIGDLLDEIVKHFDKWHDSEEQEDDTIKIAVAGKPNAGKSSLVNKILGYDRAIVTDIAGTTRDAIDTPFKVGDKNYVIIDTAGLRRKSKVLDDVEYYANIRSVDAIRRADVVCVVIDASQEISEQDVRICGLAHDSKKPSIIVMNKWDTIEKDTYTINKYNDELKEKLKFMDYFVSVYISALTGKRVPVVLEEINKVYERAYQRVATGILNEIIHDAIAMNEPPTKNGKKLKIYYASQVEVCPPSFVLFVNDPAIIHFSYKRYLENALRKAIDFRGVPIRIMLRNNKDY
ncbi:MAG: ribosome biogenesis GTPase Der [Clostridia bacterium]